MWFKTDMLQNVFRKIVPFPDDHITRKIVYCQRLKNACKGIFEAPFKASSKQLFQFWTDKKCFNAVILYRRLNYFQSRLLRWIFVIWDSCNWFHLDMVHPQFLNEIFNYGIIDQWNKMCFACFAMQTRLRNNPLE